MKGKVDEGLSATLKQKQFYTPGNIWQCFETFLVVTTGETATGIQGVGARDAAKPPTMYRTVSSHNKELSAQRKIIMRIRNPGLDETRLAMS